MVIKKSPKTGKYYIAPSPPSFYKSKPAPSKRSGGGGSSSGKTESQLIAEMRAGGKAYLKKHPGAFGGGISPVTGVRTKPTTTEKKLVASLTAKAEITQKAKDKKKGLTRLQIQRELRKRGTSISELRKATNIARAHFKRTGVSITGQIRKDIRERRLAEQQKVKEFKGKKKFIGPVRPFVGPVRPQPFLQKVIIDVIDDIPTTQIRYYDPVKKIDRKATKEETKLYRESEIGVMKAPKLTRLQKQQVKIEKLIIKQERGQKLTLKEEAELQTRTVAYGVSAFGTGIVMLPKTLYNLAKHPSSIKKIPSAIVEGGEKFGQLLRVSPTTAFVKLGTEVYLIKGMGKLQRITGKVSSPIATKLNPKFRGLKKGVITIPSQQTGKTLKIKISGPVSKIKESLKQQAQLAGKRVTAVSAQADRLVNLIKTKRIIRKPIPGEATLTTQTKKLLNKFDTGKLSKKELILLDKRIKIETKGQGNILERSFFADPRGRMRPSRLGLKQKEASLLDYLSGDISFKTPKPQILIFEDIKIQSFPKSLSKVAQKLKTNKPLTVSESNKLINFQTKVSGKFKPIGALSKEPEITLAPGEIVKKVKTSAVTIINGRRVPIIRAKVIKASPTTKKLLKKSKAGTITQKEIQKLTKNLEKETGFKSTVSRSTRIIPRGRIPISIPKPKKTEKRKPKRKIRKPVRPKPKIPKRKPRKPIRKRPRLRKPIRPKPRAKLIKKLKRQVTRRRKIRRLKKISRKARPIKRKPRKPIKVRVPVRGRPRPRIPIRPRIVPRPIPRPRPRPRPPIRPIRPIARPPIKGVIPKKQKPKRKIKRKVRVYNVYAKPIKTLRGKKAKKLIKINKYPLSKSKAQDLRNFITDTSLSRTARIQSTKGKVGKPRLKVPRGYAKRTSVKFRKYKIVKGKRKLLKRGKVIEKRGRLLDTRSEKRGVTLRRRLKQITIKPKRKPIKKPLRGKRKKTTRKQVPKRRRPKRRPRPQRRKKSRR